MHSQTLYILQGVPGSGKSTLALALALSKQTDAVICSTDHYFTNQLTGAYEFNPSKLGEYHAKNLETAKRYLALLRSVVIDNTNIKRIHVKPYVEYACLLDIPVVFIRVNGPFQSVHGVPQSVIERMRSEMEELTIESVLAS